MHSSGQNQQRREVNVQAAGFARVNNMRFLEIEIVFEFLRSGFVADHNSKNLE
jgi:hypothetical protein